MNRLLLVVLCVWLSGCELAGCAPDTKGFIPASASLALKSTSGDELLGMATAVQTRLDETWGLSQVRESWRRSLGLDPWQSDTWHLLGIDTSRPVDVFLDEGLWVIHGTKTTDGSAKFDTWIRSRETAKTFLVERRNVASLSLEVIALPVSEKPAILARATRGNDILIVVGERLAPTQTRLEKVDKHLQKWMNLSGQSVWASQPWTRDFQVPGIDRPVVGGIKPRHWLARESSEGHAALLWLRLRNQLGPIAFAAHFDKPTQTFTLDVQSTSDPREPAFVRDLQGASGDLPAAGALVVPGVLAVARLSVNPRKFYELVRSTFPAEQRLELDRLVHELDEQLAINIMDDLLDNLYGHIVVVVYGFDARIFKEQDSGLLANILFLKGTREAVYIPVKSRQRIEDLLNAWTQISKGKLNRQVVQQTIQYAWFEDGNLTWALLLGPDHVILVDSTAAFDRAMAFQRSAPSVKAADERVMPLLEGRDLSGFFVDTRALANLMGTEPLDSFQRVLEPLKSVRVISETMDNSVSRMTIRVDLDDPIESMP